MRVKRWTNGAKLRVWRLGIEWVCVCEREKVAWILCSPTGQSTAFHVILHRPSLPVPAPSYTSRSPGPHLHGVGVGVGVGVGLGVGVVRVRVVRVRV